jgi:RNA polymerase sigma-70 factor (ECF subfamily)
VDDLALARALTAGDESAFRLLVERETASVFRICYRILGRVDEAEDAAQETFVLAYRSLDGYRGEGPAAAWLARIATRESWRRANARARRAGATVVLDDALAATVRSSSDPLGEVMAVEQQEAVRRAVAALSEPYREVVALRFFAELPLAAIAAETGRPEGTVKAQLHRGLQRLRAALAPAAPEPRGARR